MINANSGSGKASCRKYILRWLSSKRICLQCRRQGFNPWIGRIPWGREWLPTPVFWPEIPGKEETGSLLFMASQIVG